MCAFIYFGWLLIIIYNFRLAALPVSVKNNKKARVTGVKQLLLLFPL